MLAGVSCSEASLGSPSKLWTGDDAQDDSAEDLPEDQGNLHM